MLSKEILNKRNNFYIEGDRAYLEIERRDGTKYLYEFDVEEFERVKRFAPWNAKPIAGYAAPVALKGRSTPSFVSLQRYIMRTPEHLWCRVKDLNVLNCRKSNLENVTPSVKNTKAKDISNTPYPYVNRLPTGRFKASYRPNNKVRLHVGVFDTAEQARDAREEWIKSNVK